jgi:dipeptidyl aminopeptidase/acylaminoacyl peptidase
MINISSPASARKKALIVRSILFLLLLQAQPSTASAQASPAPRGLAANSLWKWQFVSDPQVSPDGSKIAYVHITVDEEKDGYKSSIWLAEAASGRLKQVTLGDARDLAPRWSPDGTRLAFLSNRRGSPAQIYVLSMDGGEARQITKVKNGASNIEWSPDGRRIAFISRLSPPGEPQADKKDAGKERAPKERVVTRLTYRVDGSGYLPEGFTHIFVVPSEGGEARQVTSGDFNHSAPDWSPDGRVIAFSAIRKPYADYELDDSEIYVISPEGGEAKALTDRRGPDDSPIWSPDGTKIAYTGNDEKMWSYTLTRLYVMNADGTGKRELTVGFDRSVGDGVGADVAAPIGGVGRRLAWSPDGKSILFTSADRGSSNIRAVAVEGGTVDEVTKGNHDLSAFSIGGKGTVAAIISGPTEPFDLYTLTLAAAAPRRLTSVNAENLKGVEVSRPESFWYRSFDGREIQGWAMKPVGFIEGRKYPMLLYIHGGPHALYGNNFFHEFQVLAARGYVVLFTNPRGSSGYGQEFGNIIQYRYPGDDYKDLMAGVDEVLKRGYVDSDRMGVMGGSGGGLLTAWVIGHTKRFAAACAQRGVYNWYSFTNTADFNYMFAKRWFKDFPWKDPEGYLARSPISYVADITTPLLIIHNEEDWRVPISQGEELFTALKMLKREVKMVRFPQEPHGLSRMGRPSHRIARIDHIVDWMDQHLKPEGVSDSGGRKQAGQRR